MYITKILKNIFPEIHINRNTTYHGPENHLDLVSRGSSRVPRVQHHKPPTIHYQKKTTINQPSKKQKKKSSTSSRPTIRNPATITTTTGHPRCCCCHRRMRPVSCFERRRMDTDGQIPTRPRTINPARNPH